LTASWIGSNSAVNDKMLVVELASYYLLGLDRL
jgi:hypothetical protein